MVMVNVFQVVASPRIVILSQQDGIMENDGVLRNSNQRDLRQPGDKKSKKPKKVKKDKGSKDEEKKHSSPQLIPKEEQQALREQPDFA